MKGLLILTAIVQLLGGCTLFRKDDNELETLTHDVLQKKQGIEIDIKPIDREKN